MRPRNFDEFVGAEHLVSPGSYLRKAVESGNLFSMILYGPPGSGKTSLAFLIAQESGARFVHLSAVSSTVKDVREVIAQAREARATGTPTVVFIDEIHRYNKAQQDALLPAVEDGTVTLIGATTENPFFEVNSPLLSRCQIIVLEPLSESHIEAIVERALGDERGLRGSFALEQDALELIVANSQGDARSALNLLEAAARRCEQRASTTIEVEDVREVLKSRAFYYDRKGDMHYDYASAFIKSMRASDPDAALVYLSRMLAGGEDPKFIARRLIIFASEDVGNADPIALLVATATFLAVERVGLPECAINLAQAVTYLATAPKSNAAYRGLVLASNDVEKTPTLTVPVMLRDTHYRGARFFGHGAGYRYPHDFEGHFVPDDLMPPELTGKEYYTPSGQGYEKNIVERLRMWREARRKARMKKTGSERGGSPERGE